ncbi:MAG: undecaprenyl-diphosphate phosphatase [Prevotella sp.]|nr:undecaprenyl-diphosphate phosphatase [Prevotella sp.]
MTVFETIILAIVEGLTEFLPVSSTGHMIITQSLLGIESTPFVKAFTIIIQFGAILSVVCLYWKRFFRLDHSPAPEGSTAWQRFIHKWDFYWKLLVAFVPAVFIGFAAKATGLIDRFLESVEVVAIMLVVGGIFMLFCDKIFNKGSEANKLTERRAFNIGLFQCIAMIPGVSRSMATIVGGMAQKLTRRAAAEFSFFLAVPTMAAATALDVLELFFGSEADTNWATTDNLLMLALGCVVAFVVALLAMKWFVNFLTKYGFKAFGVYRIIVGGIILILLMTGHSLVMVD